jgi:hypothetical protein
VSSQTPFKKILNDNFRKILKITEFNTNFAKFIIPALIKS